MLAGEQAQALTELGWHGQGQVGLRVVPGGGDGLSVGVTTPFTFIAHRPPRCYKATLSHVLKAVRRYFIPGARLCQGHGAARLFVLLALASALSVSTAAAASRQETGPKASLVTVHADNEPIRQLLLRIGMQAGLSIVIEGNIAGRASANLVGVPADEALSAVLRPLGLTYERDGRIVLVHPVGPTPETSATPLAPAVLNVSIISAQRAATILSRLYPRDHVTVDKAANALIVVGPPDDVTAMRTVLNGIDVKNPQSVGVDAVQVKIAKAKDVVAKLAPLYPHARLAVGPNQTVLIAANSQDMPQIKALISSIDTPTATPTPTSAPAQAIKVLQAKPLDVARAIEHQFPQVRASVAGSSVILSGSPDDLDKAKALVALIDQPAAWERYTQVYRLRFVDAKSVADLISRSFPDIHVDVDEDLNAISVRATAAEQQRIADAIAALDTPPGGAGNAPGGPAVAQPGSVANTVGPGGTNIEIVSLKAAAPGPNGAPSTSAADIATTVTQALQPYAPDLHITVPPNSTQLVLTGSAYSIKLARDMINQLDVAQKLVVLDTEILEVDETVAKNLGLSLSPVIATTYSEIAPVAPPGGGTPPPLLGVQPFTRTALSFTATLNLLVQRGQARVLADPRITTISGRTATIRAGDNISILTTTGGGPGTIATTQVQTFQTGVTLDITPVINSGNFITVSLHPVVNSLSGITNGVPQISTRETETTVGMQEDQTLVIGGLIEDSVNRSETRIPFLGDLPLVGRLFRSQTLNRTRNELIITVTPHIVYPGTRAPLPGPPLLGIPTPQPLPTLPPGTQIPGVKPPPGMPVVPAVSLGQNIPAVATSPSPPAPAGSSSPTTTPAPSGAAPTGASPAPTPSAFAQTNVFVYGAAPTNTYAGAQDPVHIFYVSLAPTVLHNGDTIDVSAITTINANTVTVSYPGLATQLARVAPGQWRATYAFNATALPPDQTHLELTLTARSSYGQSASIQIPVSIAP
jgi:type II secretory pathway component GspD/PulD (secretin)